MPVSCHGQNVYIVAAFLNLLVVTKFIRIGIADKNDSAPFFDKVVYETEVDETEDIGNIVLNVTAKSHNDTTSIRYEITSGNLGNAFAVNETTGEIFVAAKLDYENIKKYELRLEAIDKLGKNSTTVIIHVRDVNDHPPVFEKQSYKIQITEEQGKDLPISILKVAATDADTDRLKNIVYFLTGQGIDADTPENSKFEINKNTGEIFILKALDRDPPNGRPLWRFTVFAQDEGGDGLVGYADIQINLKDINDNAPFFPEDVYFGNVTENGTSGMVVMTVTAVDYDDPTEGTHAKISYSIEKNVIEEETGDSIFDIDPETGTITTAVCCLDRERTPEYTLQIIATDGGGLKGTGTAKIFVEDINDIPPSFTKPEWFTEVDETVGNLLPKDSILTVTVQDEDEKNNFQYKVVKNSGFGWDKFEMVENPDGTGSLKVIKPLDYEDSSQRNGFKFQIQVNDGADQPHIASAWVIVKLKDINDNNPVFDRSRLEISIPEDVEVGKSLVKFSAKDPDKNGRSSVLYFIDKKSNKHKLFSINNRGVVSVQKQLDREKSPFHELKILAIDDGVPERTATASLLVTVTDVNDNAPKFLKNYRPIVMEHVGPSKIAEISALDEDDSNKNNGGPFEYWLDPTADERVKHSFMVEQNPKGAQGQGTAIVRSLRSFDREQQKEFFLPIVIKDSGNPPMSGTSTLVITIGDINDNKMSEGFKDITFYNYKGRRGQTDLGTVYVQDADDWDLSDKKFYWEERQHGKFHLNESTGMIYVTENVAPGAYRLRFKVFDRKFEQTVSAEVKVVVKNLPEEAFTNSGSLRIEGVSDEDFVRVWDYKLGDLTENKLEKFRKKIAEMLKTSKENVEVFGVQLKTDHPVSVTDVRFSVQKEQEFVQATTLNGVMMMNREKLEEAVGINITMIGLDECLDEEENNSCDGSCRNNLIISALSYMVNSNKSSLAGPKITLEPECTCKATTSTQLETCKNNPCLNKGKCITVSKNSAMCSCPLGFDGPRCQKNIISFKGNGFSWFPPLEVCDINHLELDFLTLTSSGMLLYNGPISHPKKLKNIVSDFILVDIEEGYPRFFINYGSGTIQVTVKTKKTLHDGDWHHLDIFWNTEKIRLIVDYCKTADIVELEDETASGFDSSSCESEENVPNFREYVNVNGPLQIGGLWMEEFDPSEYFWEGRIKNRFFNGCIRDVYMNSRLIDLGNPAMFRNVSKECHYMEEMCQKLKENVGCEKHGSCNGNIHQAECQCKPGWTGLNCSIPTIPTSFSEQSYIKYALSFDPDRFQTEIQLKFRTREKFGELFRISDQNNREYVVLDIRDSVLCFRYNLNSVKLEETKLVLSEVNVDDGQWHLVKVTRYGSVGIIKLDDGEGLKYNETFRFVGHQFLHIDKQEGVFVGGKAEFTGVRTFEVLSDFRGGCIDDVRLNGKHLPLPPSTNGTQWGQATITKNIRQHCISANLCSTNTCPEPFLCEDLWNAYECTCRDGEVTSPDSKACLDKNECSDFPCMNGGCCINLEPPVKYRCVCSSGFTGTNCELLRDEHTVKLSLEALSAILVCLFIIFVLITIFVFYGRSRQVKKKKPPSPQNDVRENVISYDDEGGGEDDMTAFNMAPLKIPVSHSKTNEYNENIEMTIIDHSTNEILNIEHLLKEYKERTDEEHISIPFDDLRNYAFEERAHSSGSLSPLSSTLSN